MTFPSFNFKTEELTPIKWAIAEQSPEMFAAVIPSSASYTVVTEAFISDVSGILEGKTILPYYYQLLNIGSYCPSPYWYYLSWLEKLQQERDITEVTGESEKDLLPSWLKKALEKIAEIRQLPQDWDSYGSLPPNPLLCDLAVRLLFDIRELDVPEPLISPSSGGLIYIKMKFRHRELVIKLDDPSGRYASCLYVEIMPREVIHEKSIYLNNEFRQMVLWLLGESDQREMAA